MVKRFRTTSCLRFSQICGFMRITYSISGSHTSHTIITNSGRRFKPKLRWFRLVADLLCDKLYDKSTTSCTTQICKKNRKSKTNQNLDTYSSLPNKSAASRTSGAWVLVRQMFDWCRHDLEKLDCLLPCATLKALLTVFMNEIIGLSMNSFTHRRT